MRQILIYITKFSTLLRLFLIVNVLFFAGQIMIESNLLLADSLSSSQERINTDHAILDDVQVVGIIFSSNREEKFALINTGKLTISRYQEGQEILPGYLLKKIFSNKVTIDFHRGEREIHLGSQDRSSTKILPPGTRQLVDGKLIESGINENMDQYSAPEIFPPSPGTRIWSDGRFVEYKPTKSIDDSPDQTQLPYYVMSEGSRRLVEGKLHQIVEEEIVDARP